MKSPEKSDPKSLDEFLMPHIASGWGISKLFFSTVNKYTQSTATHDVAAGIPYISDHSPKHDPW